MLHFHSIQWEDIICKYKLSSYSEQGLQSQEPKHSTKSLAINTSFDPGEWQMKPFMGGNRQKCTSRLRHSKENISLYTLVQNIEYFFGHNMFLCKNKFGLNGKFVFLLVLHIL